MAHAVTREEHPAPAIVMHWLHLVSMLTLIFTGFYIHWPFFAGGMQTMRTLHFIFMFLLIYTAVARVYWAFLGRGSAGAGSRTKVRDYRHFFPQKENRGQFWQSIKYYLFMRKTHPRTAKYNPLQKSTYAFWLALIVVQAISGFALWTPTASFFEPMTYALGGPQLIRMYHYLIMWLFIITTLVHVYLTVAEARAQLPLMLWGKETTEPADMRTGA